MRITHIVTTSTLLLALAAPAIAQVPDKPEPPIVIVPGVGTGTGAGAGAGAGRNGRIIIRGPNSKFFPVLDPDALYDQARQAIENNQFDRAIQDLDRLLAEKLSKVDEKLLKLDAAMYWKAYSQAKLDLNKEALQTVAELARQFAASPWVKDARALAVEVQQAAGQPVSAELQNDEELKLLALRGVMQADPDKGVPIIEKMLAGGASPRVRDRALFVLSQSRATRARDVMINTAKNNANPDLQRTAIRYLGMMGGADDRDALAGVYRTATDMSVKRTVINSLFMLRSAKALVDLARAEKDSSLKREIVSKLSTMKAPEATDYMLELLK